MSLISNTFYPVSGVTPGGVPITGSALSLQNREFPQLSESFNTPVGLPEFCFVVMAMPRSAESEGGVLPSFGNALPQFRRPRFPGGSVHATG